MSALERVRFGRTGLMVSRIAFGGIPIQRLSRHEAVRIVTDALALGINFIDTAHSYGHSEEVIGEAIRDVPRDDLVIATKSPAADRTGFLADLDESLRRLRTDRIDIFQFHGVSSRERLGGEWCHRCDYCQPCPQGIRISPVLVAKSFAVRMPVEKVRSFVEAAMKAAESCTECRQCVERCPYRLDIPVLLQRQRAIWGRYLATGRWE